GFVFDTLRPETAVDREGEVVGTVEATDPNGESLTFAIVDGNDPDENDTNAFEIDPDSGEISLLDADELTQNYELTVEANNGDETTRTAVIIPVNTANDAPIIDETDFVSENVGTGGIVGIVNAVDPDGDDLEFELSGAGDQLAIDEDGVVTITSDADFTLGDSIDFEVTATDEVGEADTAEISLNFRDLVELDPETGTQIIGSEDADFARDITSDRGGNLFIGGETAGVLSSAEPPIIRDGFVNGDTITLRYNKPLDASAGPARSDFDVVVNTVINDQIVGSPEISVSNVDIDGQSVILSLTQEVTQDDGVGVSYEDPSDFDDENAIQDRFGNDAADLSLQVVNLTGTGEDIPELPEEENEEENAGALDIWLSRLGDNDPSPAAGTTESAEPPQPTQSVFTDIDEVTAQTPIFQNTSFNFDVNYSAIDAEGNSAADLSGLGLRMHFDSDVLDLEDIDLEEDARTPDTQPVNLPNDIQEDTNNFDGDGSTDSFVLLSWSDVNEAWPGDSQLERPLFNATFKTERDFAGDVDSTINFTASSTADGFSFASSDPVIEPDKYTYDVDDNGDVDALTDGLQILNFLFDNNNRAIDSAIASNANRETEEVTDFLNLGGNSSAFDVDGNGNEDALTDGILIVRYMFGFRGEALINDAIADNAERTTPGDIEGYIQDFLPS
ncbi:MAG: SwmB domain-containing protein, partial [Halothece sp.]